MLRNKHRIWSVLKCVNRNAHTLVEDLMDTPMKSTVPEVGSQILWFILHINQTLTYRSFPEAKLFPSDGGEPDKYSLPQNIGICSMAHWRSGRTEALQCGLRTVRHEYFMSLSTIPCLTPTLSLLLKKVSCFSSAWIATNSKIPLCLHILWVFLENL